MNNRNTVRLACSPTALALSDVYISLAKATKAADRVLGKRARSFRDWNISADDLVAAEPEIMRSVEMGLTPAQAIEVAAIRATKR